MQVSESANADTEVLPALNPPPPSSAVPLPPVAPARKSHKALYVVLASLLGAVVVLGVAAFCMGHFYFMNRAGVGVSFAGESVTGKTSDELAQLVESKVSDTSFVVSTDEGKSVTASYEDLGVTPKVKATVDKLLNAKGTNPFTRINPFDKAQVALVASMDDSVLQEYLTSSLVDSDSQIVNPSVTYDAEANTFLASEGKSGEGIATDAVKKAISTSYAQPAASAKVSVEVTEKKSSISYATAQTAAAEANARLSRTLVISNGSAKKFTVPAAKIGEWTDVKADSDTGTLTVSYDTEAIASYLKKTLPTELKQKKVDQENLVTPAGTKLLVKVTGVNGVEVVNTSDAVQKVTQALQNNTDVSATVSTKVVKYSTKDTQVPHNFDVENGDPWLQVNLSKQTVTAYRGTTKVKSFLMSSGVATSERQSDTGTFYVWHKTTSQTMTGPGYVTPNVKWVSYYNGGEAFHGAPWNPTGIALGIPKSHGCINMSISDAEWVYNFAPIGTKVVVTGNTPTSAVRGSSSHSD
ncbi:MAG: L,D-transpeptidase [Bifidobacteriaceae bacterium]|jgi:lipoprotein-anchoring transpeptidase ErfK/SrfK|nr:L,D-transpeptidase [Bifidobacteriaceae bacterium]MCI1979539.1 L,D-transpeptidase [Bifidobacteriaceae bacterium]